MASPRASKMGRVEAKQRVGVVPDVFGVRPAAHVGPKKERDKGNALVYSERLGELIIFPGKVTAARIPYDHFDFWIGLNKRQKKFRMSHGSSCF